MGSALGGAARTTSGTKVLWNREWTSPVSGLTQAEGIPVGQRLSDNWVTTSVAPAIGRDEAAGALASELNIMRPPNLTDRGTLTNLFPGDIPVSERTIRSLVQDESGRYWLQGTSGNRITPSGSYDFVTMPDGVIRVARPNNTVEFSTHLGLSGGGEVNWAGSVRFGNNMGPNRGTILGWTNKSGHYQPPAYLRGNAGLPDGLFRSY